MSSPEDRNLGLPCGSNSKENACNAGDLGPIPGSGGSPGMAAHSSILAWRISWTEEPGRLHTVHGVTVKEPGTAE